MARRGAKSAVSPQSKAVDRPGFGSGRATSVVERDSRDDGDLAVYLGERIRRIALGATAALMTARAFWPSEPDMRKGAGGGLPWVLALLIVFGLALAGSFLSGRFRFRWSWTDALVVALTFLVAVSATHAVDRRPALNLAWEWAAMGFAYVLLRNLPRTRSESTVLAGALVATAFAVSCYGLYQVKVELPILQARFRANPNQVMQEMGIAPGPRSMESLKNRLVGSNEPWSTFALPNSLAGFIVGPLVLALAVGFQNLVRRGADGSRWTAIGMATPVILVILLCLIWTKSRSASIGLFVGLIVWAWQSRRLVPPRLLWATGAAGFVVVTALVLASLASGRLDREVLTQSSKSARYRWEYWQATWGVISNGTNSLKATLSSPTFWFGVGPGNFAAPYLLHKLPEASEEILDPHNLFLEVWATGGFWALLALVLALGWGLKNLLGPPSPAGEGVDTATETRARRRGSRDHASTSGATRKELGEEDDAPPRRVGWLIASAGAGWALVVILPGALDPFQGDLFYRWLILGASWLTAVLLGAPLWGRLPVPAQALAVAVLGVVISLLAAGGIGIPTVALGLWSMLALGLNLRDDRPCSRLREVESRVPAFAVAVVWVALLGTFVGAVTPFWRSEAAIALAEEAINHLPPDYDRAGRAYDIAKDEDRYNVRPWLGLAYLESRIWEERGAKADDLRWKEVPILLHKAVSGYRSPNVWSLHSERANAARRLLNQIGPKLNPTEVLRLRAEIVRATRAATLLYPTNADLRARLAEASAEMSMFQDAMAEAKEALRLDGLTPHLDKKLPEPVRKRLEEQLPKWSEAAAAMPVRPDL
jgi:O-Antigen ligase